MVRLEDLDPRKFPNSQNSQALPPRKSRRFSVAGARKDLLTDEGLTRVGGAATGAAAATAGTGFPADLPCRTVLYCTFAASTHTHTHNVSSSFSFLSLSLTPARAPFSPPF